MRTSLNSKPISEIHQQFVLGNVNLSPEYQRKVVCPYKNKVYLIDSIIQGLPLPKFFVQIKIDIPKYFNELNQNLRVYILDSDNSKQNDW